MYFHACTVLEKNIAMFISHLSQSNVRIASAVQRIT